MVVTFPPCPDNLKSIQPYLKIAAEHDDKDPIVSYWCRIYSLQTALNIDKNSDAAKALLLALMDWLEKTKRAPNVSESITSEVVAQAYIENYALKLFVWADNMDRSGQFNKNVVKSFYASGVLLDVMTVFGELNEDLINNRKYGKWKAAYIHNCLKNGETPITGPVNAEVEGPHSLLNDAISDEQKNLDDLMKINKNINNSNNTSNISDSSVPSQLPIPFQNNVIYNPHSSPSTESPDPIEASKISSISDGVKISASQISKAQKYCKFATSALNYDDVPEAISNLRKALTLLQTGIEDK